MAKKGRQESAVRHGGPNENLFGILLFFSEENLLRTRRLVRRVVSGIAGHVVARESEVLLVVHNYGTRNSVQFVTQFVAQFRRPELVFYVVFRHLLTFAIRDAHFQ